MNPKELRSCCCVCSEWNDLITESVRLTRKKSTLDPYEKISRVLSFEKTKEKPFVYPSSICVLPEKQEILICDDYSDEVEVFNMKGEFISSFGSKGSGFGEFNNIIGICTFEGKIFIADKLNCRIQVLDQHYNYLSTISTDDSCPEWICCQKNGNIIVSTEDSLLLFEPNGEKRTLVSDPTMLGIDEITGICCNDKDEIIIANSSNDKIQLLDKNGLFLSTIHFDRYAYANDICVDQN